MRILFLLAVLLISGCVTTTRTYKPVIVTTYQYKDVWVLECLSNSDADSIIKIVSSQTTMQIIKISYSARELMKSKGDKSYVLPCDKVDVFTAAQGGSQAVSGTAYEVEKKNGVWVGKGSYKWSY
jgi:hypothetical protein